LISTIAAISNESTIASDRLFCGRQPDDFALSAMIGSPLDICMLGVGLGGAFNAIAALAPGARLVGVERDGDRLAACRALQRVYYPKLGFDLVAADASAFVAARTDVFDAINVDLYHDDAYSPLYFDPGFWSAIKRALHADGVLIVNAMGFPEHLAPLSRDTAQARTGEWLTTEWPHVVALPNRRNTTFVASSCDLTSRLANVPPANDSATPVDHAILRAVGPRLRAGRQLASDGVAMQPTATRLSDIDGEVRQLLPGFVAELVGAGAPPSREGEHPASYVRRLMLNRDDATAVTLSLLESGRDELASFLPACFASFRCEGRQEYDWVVAWLAENLVDLDLAYPLWTRTIAVWQALAAMANPFTPYPVGARKLLIAIDEAYPAGNAQHTQKAAE
jgi:hypothetical protein